jgi:hypothetical protein
MSDDETGLIAAEAAEHFKRQVEQAGTVRVNETYRRHLRRLSGADLDR